jgi:beta-glucosidase-like glycosyl hydrolase/CubicO group peptidase (beta-lactamase class C family)
MFFSVNRSVSLFRLAYPLAVLCFVSSLSANRNLRNNLNTSLDSQEARWVDSVFNSLNPAQRVGQLFMLRAHSDKDSAYEQNLENLIRKYQPGGLCFFQGTPERQAMLTTRYQMAHPRLPMIISMDAEWGLGMRLRESTISFPKQLTLGAIQDNKLIYNMGQEVARECRRLGVHMNFAPVADVNNNPENPVINDRSFGEDRINVAEKCYQYMLGMQEGGVLACAKHFPGHGDTDVDSHEELPVLTQDRHRLDSLELYPFQVLAKAGVSSIMVAHLNVPALDNRAKRPTTLSRPTVTGLLRENMHYDGLIVTDAMEMQGVTKYFKPGEAELEALKAGNDIILLPGNLPDAFKTILEAMQTGELNQQQVDASVKRVLRAKYRLGLMHRPAVDPFAIRADLNRPKAMLLKRQLLENALTLVRDDTGLAGFAQLDKLRIATVAIGDSAKTPFQTTCGWYGPMDHFQRPQDRPSEMDYGLLETLKAYDIVLVSIHGMKSKAAVQYGVSNSALGFLQRLEKNGVRTGVVVFGNPYSLKFFEKTPLLVCAYNDEPLTQELAAQALFGAVDFKGQLPVTAAPNAQFGQGIQKTYPDKRMAFDLPESVGLSSDTLATMDIIIQDMINTGAAPGCQVLVARNNRVVWYKAYGYQTYEQTTPVALDNLYDLASVTKITATTPAMMQLSEQGCINLQLPIGNYLPEAQGTNKENLTIAEMMAHHAGLISWIPFYESTLAQNGLPDQHIYHRQADADSPVPVAKDMYMVQDWVDTLWHTIFQSELRERRNYRYSDLGLYLSARVIEKQTGQTLDAYVDEAFYQPLGMATTTYNPWKRNWITRCVPTEEDRYFRQQRLQGYVHDMGAAMLGGVAGHAGVFSNANDLAKLFQMLLNGGHYAGRQYLSAETVRLFTTRYPRSSRRGLGFDMKDQDASHNPNMSTLAGPNTFGHLGFTGNAVWVDPESQLIFIFLSNRTYPTMRNNKLITMDYRIRLQDLVYRAMGRTPEG